MSEYLQPELPTIELFQKLGYDYFNANSKFAGYDNMDNNEYDILTIIFRIIESS